jgi:hypothetical protein
MARSLGKRRVIIIIGLMVVGLIGAFVGGAYGSHVFTDVPATAGYHNDVTWLANTGVTAGCGGTKFCPEKAVTRGQMAVFLHKMTNRVRTGHFSCDAYGFQPASSSTSYFIGTSGITADGPITCAAHLPDGATVTKFTVNLLDVDPEDNELCSIRRRPLDDADNIQLMASVTSSGTSGVQEVYEAFISAAVIDNALYAYYFYCNSAPSANASTAVYGATLDYTYPGIPAP